MLFRLSAIKGGVSKKDLLPILNHIKIGEGSILAYNGKMTIKTSFPIILDTPIIVPAIKFISAIKSNKGKDIKFGITEGGKLSIRGKQINVLLPILNTEYPALPEKGDKVECPNLISSISKLVDYIGEDASRPWACGIKISSGKAWATNNTILAETSIDWNYEKEVVLPYFLVTELISQNKIIENIFVGENTITFNLADEVTIISSLLPIVWPPIDKILENAQSNEMQLIPTTLLQDVQSILPFCAEQRVPRIEFAEDGITTEKGDSEGYIEGYSLPRSSWRAENLINLLNKTKHNYTITADFNKYPAPCPWECSDGSRGVIVGLK